MDKILILDFFANWCGPCKMQSPILEELKERLGDKIEIRKVDVDTNYELANVYSIRAIPTLIIEKNGELIKKYIGVTKLEVLEQDIIATLSDTKGVKGT